MKSIYFSTVGEALQYLSSAGTSDKGVVLFAPVNKIPALVEKDYPNLILCSSSGEYTCDGFKDGVISGFEYDQNEAEVVEILNPPIKSIELLKRAYEKVKNNSNAYMLLLCDGLSAVEESIMTTLYFVKPDFKVIGGSAGDNLQFKETYIYIGGKRVKNVALFVNERRRTKLVKENIYARTGKTLLVTRSDVLNRIVYTFNDQPASLEYAKSLGIPEQELTNYFMENPLGKVYKDDIYIASPMKVNPDRSITFYCELMPNTFVDLLKTVDPIAVLRRTLNNVDFKPSFVLAINCILRSLKYIEEGLWEDFDKEMLAFCKNTTGFISYGEQFYKNHANQTMVMLMVE